MKLKCTLAGLTLGALLFGGIGLLKLLSNSPNAASAVPAAPVESLWSPARMKIPAVATSKPATLISPKGRPLRVLHIMSYDSDWAEWTLGQLDAFKDAMAGVQVDYRIVEMDVRRNTSAEWKKQAIEKAKEAIDTWNPDLVYTTDDFVQGNVVSAYRNKPIPFVFSGVNAEPEAYGFTGTSNITGVLEREHIAQTVRLLVEIVPTAKRLAVISDKGETWGPVIQRIKALRGELEMEVVTIDQVGTFADYKEKVKGYQGRADAILTLGIFNLADESGKNVPLEDVMRWTYEEVPLPNISFWASRVPQGLLCAMSVSAQAQGAAAGEIARAILVDGRAPSQIEIKPTVRGQPIVNLAVAKRLGIKIPSSVLLSAKVVKETSWKK